MRKILLILLGCVFTLQGCVVAVVAAAAVTGGAIVADNRSTKTMMNDRDLAYKIQAKFSKDQELKSKAHLEIATFNGVVLLVGQTPTTELRSRAVSLANSVAGIRLLHNEISIGALTTTSQKASDSWLTTKVKSVLVADQGLKSAQIKVVTESGVVYLMGLITKSQGDFAAQKVSQVEGVKRVVKLFEYMH